MDGAERRILLARVSRKRSIGAHSLAFVDAIEDCVEVLSKL
jgi:hypothetical protein